MKSLGSLHADLRMLEAVEASGWKIVAHGPPWYEATFDDGVFGAWRAGRNPTNLLHQVQAWNRRRLVRPVRQVRPVPPVIPSIPEREDTP